MFPHVSVGKSTAAYTVFVEHFLESAANHEPKSTSRMTTPQYPQKPQPQNASLKTACSTPPCMFTFTATTTLVTCTRHICEEASAPLKRLPCERGLRSPAACKQRANVQRLKGLLLRSMCLKFLQTCWAFCPSSLRNPRGPSATCETSPARCVHSESWVRGDLV